MFSKLRKHIVYTDISSDIIEHDEDMDGELWSYDEIEVYRGSFDPRYTSEGLHVYWLYDDNLKRVGLAEHEIESPEVYRVLWFRDTPFGTLFQEDGWVSKNCTLWSLLSNEAYQDCIEDDFKSIQDWALRSGKLLMTPSMCTKLPMVYTCKQCGKKSFSELKKCLAVETTKLDISQYSILFLDESFVLYDAPKDSIAHQRLYACEEQVGEEARPLQEESRPDSQESQCLEEAPLQQVTQASPEELPPASEEHPHPQHHQIHSEHSS